MTLTLPQIGAGFATLLPKAAVVLLILLIAHNLANLTWRLVAPPAESALDHSATVSPGRAAIEQVDYAMQIARLHLFGEADAAASQQILANAPETQLNLVLLGVYATDEGDDLAIINGGNEEKVYGIGDEITGGVTLEAVYADRVIIAHNARNETLRLRKDEDGVQLSVQTLPEYGVEEEIEDEALSDFSSLGELREELISNPEQLGRLVNMQPVNEDGQFRGYRIESQGGGELFTRLGLQDGDVVTAVNNVSLNRPEQGMAALRDLVSADQVTLTVLRNGSELTLQHSFQ